VLAEIYSLRAKRYLGRCGLLLDILVDDGQRRCATRDDAIGSGPEDPLAAIEVIEKVGDVPAHKDRARCSLKDRSHDALPPVLSHEG
jgi:hypothetical protein